MSFKDFKQKLTEHTSQVFTEASALFTTDIDPDKIWDTYLESFPPGANNLFRERREHDCSSCRHFIKSFGGVLILTSSDLVSIWDFRTDDEVYQPVIDALSVLVHSGAIQDKYETTVGQIGVDHNAELREDGTTCTWEHLNCKLPKRLVLTGNMTPESVIGSFRDTRNVFKRSLDTISEEALSTVLELVSQNSLYKGEEWQSQLKKFQIYAVSYNGLVSESEKEIFCWINAVTVGAALGKLRNTSMGTLLVDISDGVPLDEAVRKFEAMVAPSNYKRPTAIFTKKMLAEAEKTVKDLGLEESLSRRFAVLDDISINDVLYADKSVVKRMSGGSVFSQMADSLVVNPKDFDRVEEITAEKFISDILPNANKVEVLVENRHQGNLVSLIAPSVVGSPSLFKWNNGFSWAYSGNMTDSMKEHVKAAGGKVDGDLRFSIQWNDEGDNRNDFDAHCNEAGMNEIYFGAKTSRLTGGTLDVDIINPGDKVAVENITWASRNTMKEGNYQMFVNCYSNKGGRKGFTAEVEFDGQVYSFAYNMELKTNQNVPVATVNYSRRDGFSIVELLPSSCSSRSVWGIDTNTYQPVSVCMYSPNYWESEVKTGNRHYFFMMDTCKNETNPNGFFNEFLREDLAPHKKVFEALGGMMKVDSSSKQLSGLGFSSTQRNSLICRVEGHVRKTLKIVF